MTDQPCCSNLVRPPALMADGAPALGLRMAQARWESGHDIVELWLFGDPPAGLAGTQWDLLPPPGAPSVSAGPAVIVAAPAPHLEIPVSTVPGPARYRLQLQRGQQTPVPIDPMYSWLPVRLRSDCPDDSSCFGQTPAAPETGPSAVRDYLARDYRSLRAALVEYLVELDSAADTSQADPVIALLELFAHLGDLLHYRLDRTATEAYLETARLRTSVRRHAALVDYRIADGTAASTWVHVAVPPGGADTEIRAGDVAAPEPGSALSFTLEQSMTARAGLSEIGLYDWGEPACCLPAGSTAATLVRPEAADSLGSGWLAPGDHLAFEVVDAGPPASHQQWLRRGQPWPTDEHGNPVLRQPRPERRAVVVELVETTPITDPLLAPQLPLLTVRWRDEDALTEPLPVTVTSPPGLAEVTVARGNLIPAHHGRLADGPAGTTLAARDGAPAQQPGREWSLIAAGAPGQRAGTGAGLSLRPDGTPFRLEVTVQLPNGTIVPVAVVASLLDAPADGLAVVVDVEDAEPPILRFQTGATGQPPPPGSVVTAAYEIGGGLRGNVATNALAVLERNSAAAGQVPAWDVVAGVVARNPLPANGGTDPVLLDDVRRDAPVAFAAQLRRAVLPQDYAQAALAVPGVAQASARRGQSGSWPVVTTVVATQQPQDSAAAAVRAATALALELVRALGTQTVVVPAQLVPLVIVADVLTLPGWDTSSVRTDLLAALRPGPSQRPGLFAPARLGLGASVYLSTVVATLAAHPGVDAVSLRDARRYTEPVGTVHDVLSMADDEVPVLDADPDRPDRGRLDLFVRAGS